MFQRDIQEALESILGHKIDHMASVSGGDINITFVAKTNSKSFFIKKNSSPHSFEILETEMRGLQLIDQFGVINTPKVFHLETVGKSSFLILEFIENGRTSDLFWEKFGRELAALHKVSLPKFGLEYSNFIGSLSQRNNFHDDFIDFFIQERITPQLILGHKNNLLPKKLINDFNLLFKILPDFFPVEPPSLIHGDLWNGNYLVGKNEAPVLIDPSVCYSHREMDLAMSVLFGGFSKRFYDSYIEAFPLQPNFEKRVELYQLYYLLVHVNLFGRSYLNSVERIVKRYVK